MLFKLRNLSVGRAALSPPLLSDFRQRRRLEGKPPYSSLSKENKIGFLGSFFLWTFPEKGAIVKEKRREEDDMKRFLRLLLVLALLVPALCFRGQAATTTYGNCGENMTWRFETETGTLVISGSGSMYKFTDHDDASTFSTAPWRSLPIKAVRVGENVTGLCAYFCYRQDELVDVSLPESLSGLSGDAFAYCTALKDIQLPQSIHTLGGGAFQGCTALETIDLSNVTYFGSEAFQGCTGLKSVIMPETAEVLGNSVFEDCTALTELPIPSGLTDIGGSAFSGTNLRTVTVPEGVTRIFRSAFSDMPYLHTVTLPLSLKEINAYAFHNCPSLRDVYYPGAGEQMGGISIYSNNEPLKEAKWHIIGVDAPQIEIRETGKTSVTLDWEPVEGAESYEIWHNAADPNLLGVFTYSCIGSTEDTEFTHLEAVPEKKNRYRVKAYDLETDTWSAFSNVPVWFCQVQRPTDNVCGDDLTWAFDETRGLLTISGSGKMYDYLSINENSQIINVSPWGELPFTSVAFEGPITYIGEGAFMGCRSLESLEIPDSVSQIGKYLCTNCPALTAVKLPQGNLLFDMEAAFRNCAALTRVTLPEGVTAIGNYAFQGCSALESVTMEDDILSIGSYAFNACENLTDFAFPASAKNLGNGAFFGCGKLTVVTVPEGLQKIPASCFRSCSSLKYLRLPLSLTQVDGSAFYACDSLSEVYYGGALADRAAITFSSGNLELENAIWHYTYSGSLPAPVLTVKNNTYGGIQIAWELEPGARYHEIGRATSPEGPYTIVAQKATSGKYNANNLDFGVEYFFRVRALASDRLGDSEYSNVVSGYRKLVMNRPNAVSSCSGENIVTWTAVEQAVGYEIYRSNYGVSGTPKKIGQTTELIYTDTTAEEGVSYYYRVIALHAQPESSSDPSANAYIYGNLRPEHAYSDWQVIQEPTLFAHGEEVRQCSGCGSVETNRIPALTPGAPAVKITGTASSGKAKLSWAAVEGANLYRVYRATSKTGTYSRIASTSSLSYSDGTAKVGTNYYYKVKAVNRETEMVSDFSNTVNRVRDLKQPVVTLKVDTASGKPKITFEKISGAEKYYIVRATSEKGTYSKLVTVTGTSYIDRTAVAGKTYYYKVKALHKKDSADSAYSEITSRVCDLAKPVVTVKLSKGDPRVTWEKISGAAKYEVWRATSKSGTYTKVKTTVTSSSFTDTNVKAGRTYYYKVIAIHERSAANSAFSAVKSITAK